MASSASLVSLEFRLKKTEHTRLSRRPADSMASIVLAKVGASAEPAMASKSASPSSMPRSSAAGKCSGLIRSKGGKPNALVQGEKKGLASDINAS
jgi:hypothetical protein